MSFNKLIQEWYSESHDILAIHPNITQNDMETCKDIIKYIITSNISFDKQHQMDIILKFTDTNHKHYKTLQTPEQKTQYINTNKHDFAIYLFNNLPLFAQSQLVSTFIRSSYSLDLYLYSPLYIPKQENILCNPTIDPQFKNRIGYFITAYTTNFYEHFMKYDSAALQQDLPNDFVFLTKMCEQFSSITFETIIYPIILLVYKLSFENQPTDIQKMIEERFHALSEEHQVKFLYILSQYGYKDEHSKCTKRLLEICKKYQNNTVRYNNILTYFVYQSPELDDSIIPNFKQLDSDTQKQLVRELAKSIIHHAKLSQYTQLCLICLEN